MACKRKYPKPKIFSSAEQFLFLKKSQTAKGYGKLRNNSLIWLFDVKPSPICRNYKIKIEFDGRSPKIFVVTPRITDLANGNRIPHLYNQNMQQLCLYRPKYNQWNKSKKIVDTIVPWIFLWLFYFEEWLRSGEWKGGGDEPKPNKK